MSGSENEKTIVVFRKFKDTGEIIALFPEIPGTYDCVTMSSYMHVGQHGAAHESVVYATLPANGIEYSKLKDELERIGYNLKVRKVAGLYKYRKMRASNMAYPRIPW